MTGGVYKWTGVTVPVSRMFLADMGQIPGVMGWPAPWDRRPVFGPVLPGLVDRARWLVAVDGVTGAAAAVVLELIDALDHDGDDWCPECGRG